MKKILSSILIISILALSTLCAMPVVHAKSSAQQASHCETGNHHDKKDASKNLMLMQDCTGVDLQLTKVFTLEKPDLQKHLVSYVLVNESYGFGYDPSLTGAIRGPPDWPGLFNATSPSIILSTQRRLI